MTTGSSEAEGRAESHLLRRAIFYLERSYNGYYKSLLNSDCASGLVGSNPTLSALIILIQNWIKILNRKGFEPQGRAGRKAISSRVGNYSKPRGLKEPEGRWVLAKRNPTLSAIFKF